MSIKKPSFLILFLLISFGSVNAVLFTPALPQISQFFGITSHTAQLTISLFLVGYALGPLFYGPLSNRFGRKIALFIGIGLEIIASLLCVLSGTLHSFGLLIVGRLLMALGASVGLKMCFTLVADCYSAEESTSLISTITLAFAITPGIAVMLGGYLTEHLQWQSCFYFSALYGIYLLCLIYRMAETAPSFDQQALKVKKIITKYSDQLKNQNLLINACIMGCGTAIIYLFAALAPFIGIEVMKLRPSQYGLWNMLPPIGGVIGSLSSAYLAKRLSSLRAILLGIVIISSGVLIITIAFALKHIFPIWLFAPLILIYIGISIAFANASTLAMQSSLDKSSTSAMMNFLNLGLAIVCVFTVGVIAMPATLMLPIVYCLLVGFAWLLFGLLTRKQAWSIKT